MNLHVSNPRRACAARVTVVVLCVCVCVCLSVKSHFTYEVSVRPENAVTYSAGNEGQNICGDLPETTAFKSYSAKHFVVRNRSFLHQKGGPLFSVVAFDFISDEEHLLACTVYSTGWCDV